MRANPNLPPVRIASSRAPAPLANGERSRRSPSDRAAPPHREAEHPSHFCEDDRQAPRPDPDGRGLDLIALMAAL